MDPNECLNEMLAAVARSDGTAALEHADNLRQWLVNGGAMPPWHTVQPPTKNTAVALLSAFIVGLLHANKVNKARKHKR